MNAPLPEPLEFLDLEPGINFVMRVTDYRVGTAVIHPRVPTARHVAIHMAQRGLDNAPAAGNPISIEVPVLRLYGQRQDEVSPASYYDISSKTLQADLLARLGAGLRVPFLVQLSATGRAPQKRYSVVVTHL